VYSPNSPSCVPILGELTDGNNPSIFLSFEWLNPLQLSQDSKSHYTSGDKPVVGTTKDSNRPTSGDVHLYKDPESNDTSTPIFYADCEGLQGGDGTPLGSASSQKTLSVQASGSRGNTSQKVIKYVTGKLRQLFWLKVDAPERIDREFIVENLYARILYTFSDVIVFVLKESRSVRSQITNVNVL